MELYGGRGSAEPLEGWLEAGGTLVVDPPEPFLPELVETATATGPDEPVRLLLSPDAVEVVATDFLLETRLSGGVERGELRLRESASRFDDRVVLAPSGAGVLVGIEDQVGLFPIDVESLVAELREHYEAAWEEAASFSTRAPSREALYATAEEYLTEQFADELERAISGASTLEWRGIPRPPSLALVVAARARAHHYDVCRWAEDVGFTSRSTIARTKGALEDDGVIAVEKVPQERGRPRQRLVVADERVATTNVRAGELVQTLRGLRSE